MTSPLAAAAAPVSAADLQPAFCPPMLAAPSGSLAVTSCTPSAKTTAYAAIWHVRAACGSWLHA